MGIVYYIYFILVATSLCYAGKFKQFSLNKVDNDTSNNTIAAEIDPKCFKPEYFIHTSGDLLALRDCTTISGSIHITGYDSEVLDFGEIIQIKGDLTVSNASSLQRIDALNLNSIGGTFELNTLTSLTSISLPKLECVDTLKWKVLPILTFVNLDSGIKNINSVVMSDTSLTGFGGFNVETLRILNIHNNRFLERIESSVSEVTGDLLIAANAQNLRVSLPNLTWARGITIKDAELINLDGLQIIEKNADFINNKVTSLKFPKLKSTGHTLSVINNKNLKDIEFKSLKEVGGGLMIIDNDKINKIDFFPSLISVGGAIEFHGDIDSNHFEQLKIVKGSAIVKSSSKEFDCGSWLKNEVSKVVRGGKIECGSGKSDSTEVLLIDESGEMTVSEPGFNEKNNNSINDKDGLSKFKQKDNSSEGSLAFKVSILSVIVLSTVVVFMNFF